MFKHFGQGVGAFLRGLNTHFLGNIGAGMIAIAQVLIIPGVSDGVTLLPAHTQNTIGVVRVGLTALGTALAYFGRPKSVPSTAPVVVPPAAP